MSTQGHNIHKLKAKDSTGRWAYYFVYVPKNRERQFMNAMNGTGLIDLEDFGRVIGSCYGEEPSATLLQTLRDDYGFEI